MSQEELISLTISEVHVSVIDDALLPEVAVTCKVSKTRLHASDECHLEVIVPASMIDQDIVVDAVETLIYDVLSTRNVGSFTVTGDSDILLKGLADKVSDALEEYGDYLDQLEIDDVLIEDEDLDEWEEDDN